MPELRWRVRWPDRAESALYSPSTVLTRHFAPGERLALAAFVARARLALEAASARVAERHGIPCARAMAEIAAIEARAAVSAPGEVVILSIEPL